MMFDTDWKKLNWIAMLNDIPSHGFSSGQIAKSLLRNSSVCEKHKEVVLRILDGGISREEFVDTVVKPEVSVGVLDYE